MSPQLQQFFLDIHQWIEEGCPDHKVFSPHKGLCSNLTAHCGKVDFESFETKLELEMLLRTIDPARYIPMPFNSGEYPSYGSEVWNRLIYKNPARLAFIKQQVDLIKNL